MAGLHELLDCCKSYHTSIYLLVEKKVLFLKGNTPLLFRLYGAISFRKFNIPLLQNLDGISYCNNNTLIRL